MMRACIFFSVGLLLAGGTAQALDTSVTLTADTSVTPTDAELVTFGLPLAQGDVTRAAQIRVSIAGVEQPIHAECGLMWHWRDNSCRSVTIQLIADMTGGDLVLSITDAGRNRDHDLRPVAHSDGWTMAGEDKASLPFPRVFAVHDLSYLATTDLIPPYLAPAGADDIGAFQSAQFDAGFGAVPYSSGAATWLFDRASAMAKAYMGTGDVRFLKEAFLGKQFYMAHVRNDGLAPRPAGGSGCWTYGSVACADGKYIYTQPAKLAWALFGDDSQWDNDLIVSMALQADLGRNQPGTRDPYDTETEGFTERAAGLTGLAEIHAYEITGNPTVLAHLNERIASLRDMQQVPKAWDIAHGWVPMSGAFEHSWSMHEGASNPGTGNTDDRRFSPWMSENIADFLWHTYAVFGHDDVPLMLRQLGNAVDLYGFASSYTSGSGVDALYTLKPDMTAGYRSCTSDDDVATQPLYSGGKFASIAALSATQEADGGGADQHNVEIILILSTALYFEQRAGGEPETINRLYSRIEKLRDQWLNDSVSDCSTLFRNVPARLFNWQHRSNSLRTYEWVKAVLGAALPPSPAR